jgi:hypothetical protein
LPQKEHFRWASNLAIGEEAAGAAVVAQGRGWWKPGPQDRPQPSFCQSFLRFGPVMEGRLRGVGGATT